MADISTISQLVQRLGFADILLWLLTFAVVYGVMRQAMPKMRKEAVAIIGMVVGFLVIMAVPTSLISFISKMSSYLILLAMGILVLVIFIETLGLHKEEWEVKEGKPTNKKIKKTFLSHPIAIVALLIIVVLIFVGAGGLNLLGLKIPYNFDITGVIFIAAIIGAILWMIQSKDKE